MKKTLSKEQARLLATECDEMIKAVPSIKQQIRDKINFLSSTDEPQEKDIKDLENSLKCVKEQLSFYSDAFRSYSRRNGKLKEEAEKDSPENLEKYASIRHQAEQIISDFDAMGEAIFRQIRIKQMARGIFVLPSQPNPKPEPPKQKDAPAPDEESGE